MVKPLEPNSFLTVSRKLREILCNVCIRQITLLLIIFGNQPDSLKTASQAGSWILMLETERNYIESHRDELLKQYGGRFLVIKGEEVTGAFDSMDEALQGAALMHGMENVLIRRPADVQMEISVPALTLGILSAYISHSTGRTG